MLSIKFFALAVVRSCAQRAMMTTMGVFAGAFVICVAPAQAGGACDLPTNSEVSQCLANEVAKAELDLSFSYRQAMDALYVDKDPATTAKWQGSLKTSERAWIAYKDSYCNGFIGKYWEGGSGQGVAISVCLLRLIHDRITTLKGGPLQNWSKTP